jgi:protein O-mannosyl-transferase
LSFKAKKDFIYQNQTLPAEELASKTGLNLRQVQKLLEKIKVEKQIASQFNNGVSEKIRLHWAVTLVPALLTFLAYLPSLNNGFVVWDDPENIINNTHIRSLDFSSLEWMFTSFFRGFWFPLNLLSLSLDYHIGGLDSRIYHVHSLVLHCLNTFLFYHICLRVLESVRKRGNWQKSTDWVKNSAFLASILFGLHPLHVETVSWATDRKDVLCGFYYLAALLVYLDYASSGKKWKLYSCLCLFVFALMSKPMAITLPLVFILLDVWPLKRRGAILEKIPFLVVAGLIGSLAPIAESQAGALLTIQELPFINRVVNSFYSIFFLLWKMLLPFDLSALYPLVLKTGFVSIGNICLFILFALISYFVFYNWSKWPFLAIAWLFYLLTLMPVSGLLSVGVQITADRYTYLTCLGPFLLLAAVISTFISDRKWMMVLFSIVLTLLLGTITILQTQTWKNSITLWENVVKIYPGVSFMAYSNLALAYESAGRFEDAIPQIDQALIINPQSVYAHEEKGVLLFHKGLVNEAIQEFKNSIALDPKRVSDYLNIGRVYLQTGKLDDAKAEYEIILGLDPKSAEAFDSLGKIYMTQGKKDQAMDSFNKAYKIEPGNMTYVLDLATTYQKLGKVNDNIELFKQAINLNPQEGVYYLDLGIAYYLKGMYPDAVDMLKKASDLQPQNSDILRKLSAVYLKVGQTELANESIQKATALDSVGH